VCLREHSIVTRLRRKLAILFWRQEERRQDWRWHRRCLAYRQRITNFVRTIFVGIVQQSAGSVQLYEAVRGGPQYSGGSSRKQPMLNLMLVCHLGFLRLQRLSRSPNARIRDPLGSCGSAMPIYLKVVRGRSRGAAASLSMKGRSS
jgi:hypothetical protein